MRRKKAQDYKKHSKDYLYILYELNALKKLIQAHKLTRDSK